MQNIEDLISKYNQGRCTPGEKTSLEQWYQFFDLSNKSDNLNSSEIDKIKEEVWLASQNNLVIAKKETGIARNSLKSLWSSWKPYAAAAVFISAIAVAAVYFSKPTQEKDYQTDKHLSKKEQQFKDISAGTKKAQLTLGDGKVISLDSARSMQLKEKDGTLIDKQSGILVYDDGATQNGKILFNTLSTPRGGEYQLVLPDGSKVWLNAASSLRFPTRFEGKQRTVFLNGEAYFEVVKNAKMPFQVTLDDGMTVEVLGTHFNIMSYSDEKEVRTTLAEGIVKVTKMKKSVLLSPSKQAVMLKADQSLIMSDANVDKALAWKDGMIEFDEDELPYIMRQLSRWYDVDVHFQGEVPKGTYNGSLRRQAPLSKVLEILKLAGVQFKLENKKLIVTGG
jgi:transmembrane sensor